MRLRTEMGDIGLMFNQCRIDEENIEWFQASAVYHDAAFAHALIEAMKQVRSDRKFVNQTSAAWNLEVYDKAKEILATWGYFDET